MGSKKTTTKKIAFKAPPKKAIPQKKAKATKVPPAKAPPAKAPAKKPMKVAVVASAELPLLDVPLLTHKARMLRLHVLSLRKRLGVVAEDAAAWIKTGAVHLDHAIEHLKEFPGIGLFTADYLPGAKCVESKKLASDFARSLTDDTTDLLGRTRTASDRDENEKLYDEADLILDTVALDLERFEAPFEDAKTEEPVAASAE